MTTKVLTAVFQDDDISDETATKHFLITWILFDCQITAVQRNIGTPAQQNLIKLCVCIDFLMHVKLFNPR